jgi:hypothetical protein
MVGQFLIDIKAVKNEEAQITGTDCSMLESSVREWTGMPPGSGLVGVR